MNDLIYNVSLDMNGIGSQKALRIRQYNTGIKIAFSLIQNGSPYILNNVNAVMVSDCVEQLPDGASVTQKRAYYKSCSIDTDNNTIVFEPDNILVQYANEYRFQLVIMDSTDIENPTIISTPKFEIVVDDTYEFAGETELYVVDENYNYVNLASKLAGFDNLNITTGRDSNDNLTVIITNQSGVSTEYSIVGEGGITTSKIANGAVTDTKIASDAVTLQKLSSSVRSSLSKADTALQSHQDISGKEDTSNKVTSVSSSSTDTQYPSAKCVYDKINEVNEIIGDFKSTFDPNDTLSDICFEIESVVPYAASSQNKLVDREYLLDALSTRASISDVSDKANRSELPTKTSDLVNDSGFLTYQDVIRTYTHTQSQSSNTWVIAHNLGKYPSVTVINSAGDEVVGDVKYDSQNQVTITFKGAFKGTAIFN